MTMTLTFQKFFTKPLLQNNSKDLRYFCSILKLDYENNMDINLPNSLYLSRTWPLYGGVAEKQPMRGGRKTTSKTDVF